MPNPPIPKREAYSIADGSSDPDPDAAILEAIHDGHESPVTLMCFDWLRDDAGEIIDAEDNRSEATNFVEVSIDLLEWCRDNNEDVLAAILESEASDANTGN